MKKILIAEDDKFLADAYRVKFENEEFEVHIAFDGDEALKSLASFKPDFILLDLVMPQKDGFTVLAEIKKDPHYNKIPVLVTTNLSQPEDIKKVKALGALDYLVKSNTAISAIVNKVKQYLA